MRHTPMSTKQLLLGEDETCRVLKIAIIGSGLSSLATSISLHQAVEQAEQQAAAAAAATSNNSEEEQAQGREQEEEDEKSNANPQKRHSHRRKNATNTNNTTSRLRNNQNTTRRQIIKVTIYERDESLSSRQEGYGLTLTYHPTGLLQQLGVLEDIAQWDNPSRSHYILSGPSSGNGRGTILGYFGNAFSSSNNNRNSNKTTTSSRSNTSATSIAARAAAGWGQRGNLRVPRQRVRQILLDKLQSFAENSMISSQVCWGHKLVDMKHVLVDDEHVPKEEEEEEWTFCCSDNNNNDNSKHNGNSSNRTRIRRRARRKMIQLDFANGKPHAYADLVIGADGIRSSVSRLWIPTAPAPRPLRIRLILGLTTTTSAGSCSSFLTTAGEYDGDHYALLKECGFYTLDIGIRLFVMPYAGNSLAEHEDRVLTETSNNNDVDHDPYNQTNSYVEPPCNNKKLGSNMRYMWQLSFATSKDDEDNDDDDNDDDMGASSFQQQWTGEELQREALARCKDWHAPVQDLIQSTPLSAIWSSHLYDRDPQALAQALLQRQEQEKQQERRQQQQQQRDRAAADGSDDGTDDDNDNCISTTSTPSVILVGDALHAMSPFKGQGANQALRDGKTVAKWIIGGSVTNNGNSNNKNQSRKANKASSSSLSTAASCAMREMVQRTAPVVQASRLAAQYWHSEACWQQKRQSQQESPAYTAAQSTSNNNNSSGYRFGNDFKFAGVESPEDTQRLLEALRKLDITAETPHLDATIRKVMQNLGMMEEEEEDNIDDDESNTEPRTVNGISQRKHMILVIPSDSDQGDSDFSNDHSNDDVEDKLILNEARAAFEACKQGDLSELRRISWNHAGLLRVAVDGGRNNGNGRSCLHHVVLAAIQSVATTTATTTVTTAQNDDTASTMRAFCTLARWLVTEAGCSLQQPDFAGSTPLDLLLQARGAVEDKGDTDCTAATAATTRMAKSVLLLAPLEQVLHELATRQAEMEVRPTI